MTRLSPGISPGRRTPYPSHLLRAGPAGARSPYVWQAEGLTLEQATEPFVQAFFEDIDALRIEHAEHYPRATTHIPEMIELARMADHVIHIDVDNYGIAEDTHQSLMHVITQYITKLRSQESSEKVA